MKQRLNFISFYSFILLIISTLIFFPIYFTKHLIFPYALHPFDLCTDTKNFWTIFKILYFLFYIISSIIISNSIYTQKELKKINITSKNSKKITNSLTIYSIISEYINYRNNWNRKNKQCNVSIYSDN